MAGEEIVPRAGDIVPPAGSQAASNGQLSQEQLVRQIEQAQLELGRTVDAITDLVKPANVARRSADKLRQRTATVDPKLVAAGAVVLVGLVGLLIWRRRR
jgi:LPXTG-motif cell wall-anchored protein